MEVLGPELTIDGAPSTRTKRVFVSDVPPGLHHSKRLEDLHNPVWQSPAAPSSPVILSASHSTGSLILQAKLSLIAESEEAVALGNAAFVTLTDFTPCSILLNIGEEYSRRIIFAYPIDASKAKTRIARKSHWIEVKAPAASALVPGGYDVSPFPVVREANGQPSSWAIPRLHLLKQPQVTGKAAKWLPPSLHQYTSRHEDDLIDVENKEPIPNRHFRTMLAYWKDRLHAIMVAFARNPKARLFAFAGKKQRGEPDLILIVNGIRHARETGG